jgi:hypothetical protein
MAVPVEMQDALAAKFEAVFWASPRSVETSL